MSTATATEKRKVLGKGLSALIPQRQIKPIGSDEPPRADPETPSSKGNPTELSLAVIQPNPSQPRTVFEPEKLEELAQSIRANGIIQPLIVRRVGDGFELVAGERRMRAARLAGLSNVPVFVQDIAPQRLLEVALIENIQREDLNPIELAHAYDRLSRELHLSQEEIGLRTGKDRSSIANTIRLLKLPAEVQRLVSENRLSMGQARALLSLPEESEQIRLAEKAVSQGLSTRQVEGLVRQLTSQQGESQAKGSSAPPRDPNTTAAEQELQSVLGTRVRIVELSDQRGRIEIEYYTQDELTRLYEQLAGK